MIPDEHATPARAIGVAGLVVALVMLLDAAMELSYLIAVANVAAWGWLVALMWHYHSTTSWWRSPVGRTTMAIKGSLWLLASAGLVRRLSEQLAMAGAPSGALRTLSEQLVTSGWVCVAVSVILRYRVIVHLQHRD